MIFIHLTPVTMKLNDPNPDHQNDEGLVLLHLARVLLLAVFLPDPDHHRQQEDKILNLSKDFLKYHLFSKVIAIL